MIKFRLLYYRNINTFMNRINTIKYTKIAQYKYN